MAAELRNLRTIVVAADCGSFSAAAMQLNTEISAVSRAVRQVEGSIGLAIFERLPRGVRLTAPGLAYVAAARDILARLAAAERSAKAAATNGAGALSIGSVWSVSLAPTLSLLGRFAATNPGVMLTILQGGHDGLLARLRSGDLHAAITATDPEPFSQLRTHDDLASMPLWLERLAVAVPNAERASAFAWADLADRWLLCRPSDDWRRFVAHVERLGGPTLQFMEQDVSGEDILALVGAGLGWAIVPAGLPVPHGIGTSLVPIASDDAALQAEAVWGRRTINPALDRFLTLCRGHFAPAPSDGAPSRIPDLSP